MKHSIKKILSKSLSVLLCSFLLFGLQMQTSIAQSFQVGDVFVGVANGSVQQWRPSTHSLIQTLNTTQGGYTTGMAFDKGGKLYVTDFSTNSVSVFNNSGVLQGTFGSGYNTPESILFDSAGNAYVGNLGAGILKFDASGNSLGSSYTGRVDWIDLNADQCTMLYTNEGSYIATHNVCTNTSLPNFADGLDGEAYALRIRKGGDVLLANGENVLRLNSSGAIAQTYGVGGEDSWFALNLDPDGTSFWSANYNTANVYKIDISTGNVLDSFNTGTGSGTVFGLAVYGEFTISRCAKNKAPVFISPTPTCDTTLQASAGSPISFKIVASDPDAGDTVILNTSGLPTGAVMTPSLPTTGNPVSSTFSWTPTAADSGIHVITYTAFDGCKQITCSLNINVSSVSDSIPQCCQGINLVKNPGFEDGNTGFTSQYIYQSQISDASVEPGYYTIATSAQGLTISPTWNLNCAADGKHLFVNGSTASISRVIWKQDVPVEFGKTYKFCVSLKNLAQCGFDVKPKVTVRFVLQSDDLLTEVTKTIDVSAGDSCNWDKIEKNISIPAGSGNTTLTISIHLAGMKMGDGNDLAIDNINFIELMPVSDKQLLYNLSFFNITNKKFSISADPVAPLSAKCKQYWEVAEVDSNYNVILGTEIVDPSAWENADPNTFNGYNGSDVLGDTSQAGTFRFDKRYHIVYGRSCKCASFNSITTIINPVGSNGDYNKIRVFPDPKQAHDNLTQMSTAVSTGNLSSNIENDKPSSTKELTIFPNPVKNILTVGFTNATDKSRLMIFDSKGSILKEISVKAGDNKALINTSGFAAGSYLIKLSDNNGMVGAKLFVKQ